MMSPESQGISSNVTLSALAADDLIIVILNFGLRKWFATLIFYQLIAWLHACPISI